jgi:hypothetical protein
MLRIPLAALLFTTFASAQILTGRLEGTIFSSDGRARANESLEIIGGAGLKITVHTDDQGRFALVLPYGDYRVEGVPVRVEPLATTRAELVLNPRSPLPPPARHPDLSRRPVNPLPFSMQGDLASLDPATVSEPLDFTGLADNRLLLLSVAGYSWTATEFLMEGMNATDSYQPGRPVMLPDVQALEATVLRSAFALTASPSYGVDVGVFLAQPGAAWHGALASVGTGAFLASGYLPPPALRGSVQQTDRYDWMTRDHAETGGPIARWADLFASGTAQWSSQTMPLVPPGMNQRSRMLYGNIRGQVRAGARDRLDALYSGSRVDLSNGGIPAGIEALVGRRMSPEFAQPGGFANEAEVDHLDFVQTGWTHLFDPDSHRGALEVRYGYAVSHLDTRTAAAYTPDQSRIELLGSVVTGAPPLENLAIRTSHQFAAAWDGGVWRMGGMAHRLTAGGGFRTAAARNRFTTPSDLNLITANGAPAFVVEYNTPLDSRERVNDGSVYAADHVDLAPGLAADVALLADFSRGSLPAQSSPAGAFFPARSFAAVPDAIVWNSLSPRAGFLWQVPHGRGFTLQGAWFRVVAPLAGRYLDFGNPNSLGGNEYLWIDRNGDGWFQPGEQGALLMRFGGPYSSIDPSLRRPYADEIHVGAEMPFGHTAVAGIRFFRRDEKQRIAAIDTGVPQQAYTPVAVPDPGPDGIFGTYDDRTLTVWQQNPATFGQDHYLLTNPAGLRMLHTGLVAEAGTLWRGLLLRASFTAEKSYGPTNPGNAVFENDSGVVGALFMDPNTAINASNRTFMDRAFVGKVQAAYRLPAKLGGLQLANIANYTDGLVFARELLVTGLAQGPMLVAATVRGSPEGGNRAQYVANWNLRVSRDFRLGFGSLLAAVDLMNVTNAGNSIVQSDITGPNFLLRLPLAIQPSRYARLEVRYDF